MISVGGPPAVATALHRDGITQVVGYFGPTLDEPSTHNERAFYVKLAAGRRTRDESKLHPVGPGHRGRRVHCARGLTQMVVPRRAEAREVHP